MKFKKLLISASAIAAGSGLLATVLTSCAKASIDEKLKITLDDNGLLYDQGNMTGGTYKFDYKKAIEMALTRSNNWVQFKNALAEEVVFNWFENRMATSKTADDKNANFRTSYDEWKYQIDKDYNDTVQNCKNKYGANWAFYLQNEYLAPLGGTEESYKHAKLAEKIKADFISKVFAKNYFGYKQKNSEFYPHIYSEATKNIDRNDLRNPKNWDKFGFFARAELSFNPGEIPTDKTKINPNWLAKNPDGDYATIQNYVFNRWFETEKPFFVDAALFKYSNPKNVATKLEEIYDAGRSGVKLPTDKPNEAFPFFGAGAGSGTEKAVKFLNDLRNGNFATPYVDESSAKQKNNGTVTIPLRDSDDGQTCLLVCGNQMFTALYTPYAMAAGNLYGQMMNTITLDPDKANILSQDAIEANIGLEYEGVTDDFNLLKNFFYQFKNDGTGVPSTIHKCLDLNTIYGGLTGEAGNQQYHCPLFRRDCTNYTYFSGDATNSGIRYITNNIQTSLESKDTATGVVKAQPWVMELNEAGIHCLTIDGYNYVNTPGAGETALGNLKKLVMYRLMQKQSNDVAAACISTDLLGESGKLKTYFNDNFTNIVLELAMGKDQNGNALTEYDQIFRTVESYKENPTESDLFLNKVWKNHELGTTYANLTNYLMALDRYEEAKKCLSTLETANNKIYSYRSKQVANAKSKEQYGKTIYENGLLAPFVYGYKSSNADATGQSMDTCSHDYDSVNRVIVQNHSELIVAGNIAGWARLNAFLNGNDGIVNLPFIKDVLQNATVNGTTSGFSPQIKTAKDKMSNRFWYKSSLVDKFMYSFMGNKSNTANGIKMNAYNYYMSQNKGDEYFGDNGKISKQADIMNAFYTTYARSKLFSGDKNLSSFAATANDAATATDYYTILQKAFDASQEKAKIENGQTSDDVASYILWKATVMYLIASDKTTGAQAFDNFYTILNSKIGDDETAIVGYLAKGYTSGDASDKLDPNPITDISAVTTTDYDYKSDLDNMFDKNGYLGGTPSVTGNPTNSKLSNAAQWNVVNAFTNKYFAGFLGLQTKASNSLEGTLQTSVFNNFAKTTFESTNVVTKTQYEQNDGCWFQFAGSKDSTGKTLEIDKLEVGTDKFDADEWFPANDPKYAPVRKVAKKIREWGTMDDLRTLAKTLTDAFDGRSDFASIADGSSTFESLDKMRMEMLKLLPSKKFKTGNEYKWFQRVENVEAHTLDTVPSIIFESSSGKESFKLLMTQLNKADAIEHTLTPKWVGSATAGHWEKGDNSPISPVEFFNILFTIASESSVQQRAITEIVKTAFGDKKLIVYDAQLYNQFDSIWIKDWTKKTLGA